MQAAERGKRRNGRVISLAEPRRVRAEVLGIALLALALLSVISLAAPQGVLLQWWHDGLVALLGWGAMAVPAALTAAGLSVWIAVLRPRLSGTSAALVVAFVAALAVLQHLLGGEPAEGTAAGGYVGLGVATLTRIALGNAGTTVALVAVLLASVVVIADRPLLELARALAGRVNDARSAAARRDDEDALRINAPRPPRQRIVDEAPKEAAGPPELAAGEADEGDADRVPVEPRLRLVAPEPPAPERRIERLRLFSDEERTEPMPVARGVATGPGVLGASGRHWTLPPLDLLEEGSAARHGEEEIRHNVRVIEETLAHFAIAAKVVEVNVGPVVTRYELKPAAGVKLSRIEALADDLALALAARSLRIEAPVPGKSVVGIEIPNLAIGLVSVRDVVQSALFKSAGKLAVALGRDIGGGPVTADLAKLPHLLIAGQTGSGKSVCINAIITSLLLNATPEEVRLLLIDPKRVELAGYNGVPHLLVPVVTGHDRILTALRWATGEMDRRYRLFAQNAARNIERYNEGRPAGDRIPYIVIVVDELADLMILAPIDVEEAITRIAQLARATGIHLLIATQRPSVEVITGLIKANIPARIAFAMASSIDSRTILDMVGAEKLLGRGDMLYLAPDQAKPIRAQGVYVSERETDRVTDFWRRQGQPEYHLSILETPVKARGGAAEDGEEIGDALFKDAVRVVTQFDRASASLLQRRLRIGYARAARLMDILEERGVVGPGEGAKARDVLITDAAAFLGERGDESDA